MALDYTDDLRLAHVLADDADALTTARYKALDLHVMTKPDLTPVTDADQAVEDGIRRTLSRARSRDAVLGEESGSTGHGSRRWVVDPIDGTKNFVRGVPVWATLISLMVEDEVVVGVVSAPQLNRRWWAMKDGGAWTGTSLLRASAIQVSDVSRIEDASLSYASLDGWEERGRLDDFMALSRRCWRTRAYGDFWSYMLVAEGAVDLAAEPDLELYDMAALDVIVREAGGIFTSLDGEPGPLGGNALASNGKLHDQALAFLGTIDEESRHAQRGGGSVHDLAERRRLNDEDLTNEGPPPEL
jgi:histidinol-phosphatase